MSNTSLSLPHIGSDEPKKAQNCAKMTPRQAALVTGRQAVFCLLSGNPLPQTFDRSDLEHAAAILGLMLAETEAFPAEAGAELEVGR